MKIILILNFLLFTICISAQEILTIGEVFDFEIGDIFQYKSELNYEPANASRITILDKTFSADNDTVFYTKRRNYYNMYNFDGTYTFQNDTISSFYTNLDSSILSYDPKFSYDTIVKYNEDWIPIEEILYDTIIENLQISQEKNWLKDILKI